MHTDAAAVARARASAELGAGRGAGGGIPRCGRRGREDSRRRRGRRGRAMARPGATTTPTVVEYGRVMRERVREAARRRGREPNAVDEYVLNEALAERKIEEAVKMEDFELAKILVEERRRKERELTPSAALAAALARRLREPNSEETELICADVVQLGDRRLTPALSRALCVVTDEYEGAAQAIEHALWMLWQKSGNSYYDARLLDGIRAMSIVPDGLPMARDIFTEIMEAKPEFAEAHNKRATTLYLMQLYDLSIEDCDNALTLNPQHFGALSGKGLCYLALHRYKDALESFDAALRINPRMEHVRRYRESLKTMIDRCETKQLPNSETPHEDVDE